ncbi:hypothetical protein DAPPUDRAFT_263859 [Daphnia pulex]|uniref:Uncharacterized protein n=1 Tax=Daphnia pulex TaxID=6669 RepID=E9HQI8_DAPPU|nr:hypothetical protein DAPPUDRAFT_263859 [Daphnia pulex]|eukprot:EFX65974.1 hypothetical protein DAPPUDRAFT_263859 [Daphnia pulex]
MASVNWEDVVRTTTRISNNFELETETKKMRAMPEKPRTRWAAIKVELERI